MDPQGSTGAISFDQVLLPVRRAARRRGYLQEGEDRQVHVRGVGVEACVQRGEEVRGHRCLFDPIGVGVEGWLEMVAQSLEGPVSAAL